MAGQAARAVRRGTARRRLRAYKHATRNRRGLPPVPGGTVAERVPRAQAAEARRGAG
jgi:hypothetical protein